jgi:D-glycerate 3-kinase
MHQTALSPDLAALLRAEELPAHYLAVIRRLHAPLAARVAAAARRRPGVRVGLTGPQGSGKTTSARVLALLLRERGLNAVILSLDDLYLPMAARQRLAAEVHPLLATRGVPGTHDVDLGLAVLESLGRSGQTRMPRFDKASDDRAPESEWLRIEGPADVILFEGWCVGARPQPPAALRRPINALERERDSEGIWRRYVNEALAGPYQTLFAGLRPLVFLRAPSFEIVLRWRTEQEHKLRARLGPAAGMSDAQLAVFIQHYERITRWMLRDLPARADVLVGLGPDRAVRRVRLSPSASG